MDDSQEEFILPGWSGAVESLIVTSILDSMSDSLLVIGHDGNILYANKITKEILGYSLEELKEKGLARLLFSNDENYEFNELFLDTVWKKSINNYREIDYRHPDGSIRRLAATTSYLLTDGEHETTFVGFIALFKDITEVSSLRRKKQELTLEKERIATEKINSLRRLAMGVAHEIRNPMVTIGGFAARILKDPRNLEETRQYAQNILEDARKLERVVDEIQAYCNLPETRFSKGALSPTVQEAVSDIQFRASQRNITIRIHDTLPDGQELLFDPLLIKMALLRLLENAIEFSSDGSKVDVSVYTLANGTVIEVRDYGSGIDERDRDFIFNRFFTTRVHASGMGLAIVERIVHEHMGNIEVDSIRGAGTAIRVVFAHI